MSVIHRIAMLAVACCCGLLTGCAEQQIREQSQIQMRDGQFETAVSGLQQGVKQFPESPMLLSALVQSRDEALARLIADAANDRAAGRLDEAVATLQRARPFDSGGKRVAGLIADIAAERRQRAALAEAETLVQASKPQAALRLIGEALKDNPRQPELVALQRQLEADARRQQVRSNQLRLSETRPISLDFRDANLRTVLDVVTRNSGVNFILDKDIRQDVRVTVYLRSAAVEDAIDLIVSTHQLAKKVIDAQTILIYPNTPEKQREHQEQVVRVFYLASAEAKGAAAFLKSMLKMREPYVDERANMLAIREGAETIELAERLVALYDSSEPEVLLELEVIEISKTRLTNLGINFPDTISLTPLSPTGSSQLTLGNIRGLNADRVGLGVAGLILNLKRQVGDFNTLANPRIRARNREKAKVLIGDKVPIITVTTGQAGFVSDSVSYIDVGLKLEVEPTIYADDEVAIRINLEVSSLASQVRTTSGSLAYQIGTRTASTALRLRDGQTQLLAGLISNNERSDASRVPGLGDLPVAGRLFSQQQDQSQRTELMLAITPRIVRNLRRLDASETEIWVGTDATPRVRAVGGQAARRPELAGAENAGAAGELRAAGSSPTRAGTMQPANASAPVLASVTPPPKITAKWQAPSEVKVGDVFLATLDLNSSVALRGLPVQLHYGAQQLQLLEIEEGDYFRNDHETTSFTQSIQAGAGTAQAGVLRKSPSGIQGQGTVFRLRLKAIAGGAAEIGAGAIEPAPAAEPVPAVAAPPDLRIKVR